MIPIEFPVDALKLIPQRGKMKLIDELLRVSEEEACTCSDMTDKTMFLTPSGHILPAALVELSAQSTACYSGYISILEDASGQHSGLLVGIQNFVIEEIPVASEELSVEIHQESAIGPFSVHGISVFSNQTQIASGALKTWEVTESMEKIDIEMQAVGNPVLEAHSSDLAPIEHDILRSVVSIGKQDDHIRARLCYRLDFMGFDGHFPEFPVLPGILILQTAETICSQQLNYLYRIKSIGNAKFAKLILPGEEIDYDIVLKRGEEDITALVRVYGGNELKARFSLTLA